MRKLILLVFSILLIFTGKNMASSGKGKGKGNPWIDAGLKGSYGATNLFNNNLLNEKNLRYNLSSGYSAGIKVGLNLNTVFALNLEAIMTQFGQEYESTHSDFSGWKNNIQLTYFEFPILIKLTKNEWSYAEFGCKIGTLSAAKDNSGDITDYFSSSNLSAIVGFGQTLWANKGLYISMGPRFTYGFTDLISENGKSAGFPFQNAPFSPASTNNEYKPTNSISASIQLNIDFDLGQIAKANCGRGSKFVIFQH